MFKKIGLIILLVVVVLMTYLSFGHYSEGARAGTIIKLSKKGIVFNTNEGELNTQMYIDDNSAASGVGNRIWEFSVSNNDSLLTEIENAMLDGHRVKLKYKERFFKLPWIGDTPYVVYDMEKLPIKK
jgi:hypothetical protein